MVVIAPMQCNGDGEVDFNQFLIPYKMFQSWAANIIKSKFEDPIPSEDLKDHFMRGEWEVLFIQIKTFGW